MKKTQPNINNIWLLCLKSALVCFVAGCADMPKYYWVKSGITNEQIRKDNFFCADMTAQKPSAYPRGSGFYYAPLDQPAYQECMKSRGYQKVTEEELRRGMIATIPWPDDVHLDATRKLCRRVTGEEGDIDSCMRYMSMDPKKVVLPAAQSKYDDPPKPSQFTTSQNDDMNVCLRHDADDSRNLKMTVSRNCKVSYGQTE
jgi:hypothetical protein